MISRPMGFLRSSIAILILVAASFPAWSEEAAPDNKAEGAKATDTGKAEPVKLVPAKAGPVFSSFENSDVGRARIYPTVANFSSRYTQRIEMPEDPPPGLKIGNTTLYPTWLETMTYEDNLFGTSRKKQDDLGLYTQPGMGISHRFSEKIQIAAAYKFGWYDYLDDKARDYLTHNADFTLNCTNIGVDGLSLNVYDTYSQTGNTGTLNDSYLDFTRQHQNTCGSMVSYELERISVSASYDYTILDVFGNEDDDYAYQTINAMFAYKLNRRVRPYIKYRFQSYDFVPEDAGNYALHEVIGGILWRPYDKFEFDWYLGGQRADAVHFEESVEGPILGMRLNYYHNEQINAYFAARRGFEVGVLTGGRTVTSVEAGTLCKIFRDLAVGGKTSWTRETNNAMLDQRTVQASMLVRYQFKRQFFFSGEYSYTGRETNQGGGYVNWNEATVGFQWRY